ncbi:MAG: hypothetical protein KBC32_07235 [Candidatus Didemnitutus sp.]|nr:hypothetical protein [Candidatus Didemnitutus sp.]
MEQWENSAERRRRAAIKSMRPVTAAEAEHEFQQFSGMLVPTCWDERFTNFLRAHATAPLLTGEDEEGHRFVFSPESRTGFWTVVQGSVRGKGMLLPQGIEALMAIAREKDLLRPPRSNPVRATV